VMPSRGARGATGPARVEGTGLGVEVSVCIAAMANWGESIVIATDQMISTDITTADAVALKILGVHPNWAVMYAGSLDHVGPILRRVRDDLLDKDVSSDDIETAATKAYQERLISEETNTVLGRFGLTMDEFLATGIQRFGETNFAQLLIEMRQVSLGPEGLHLLVAGYDAAGGAHIFSISPPGKVENHDLTGFWAIGSGQYSALSSLFFHSYNKKVLTEQAVYHVCEAKFMAERAAGVGLTSSILILDWALSREAGREQVRVRELKAADEVKQIWSADGKPRVPEKLHERMKAILGREEATQEVFLGFRTKRTAS